jgi:hypothetical protein
MDMKPIDFSNFFSLKLTERCESPEMVDMSCLRACSSASSSFLISTLILHPSHPSTPFRDKNLKKQEQGYRVEEKMCREP